MMWRKIVYKFFYAVLTLWGISVVAFGLIRLVPGDPLTVLVGERGISPQAQSELRSHFNLDRPLIVQYGTFIFHVFQGDFGQSIVSHRPVLQEFIERFPATFELTFLAMTIAIVIGLPLGIFAATHRGSFWDILTVNASLTGYSLPIFWWGLILILFFSVFLGWMPVAGRISPTLEVPAVTGFFLLDSWISGDGWNSFVQSLRHLCLPAVTLATVPLASLVRMSRSCMLEVLREDYMRTACAKGLSPWRVVMNHGLRNALIPIVAVIGVMGSSLLTGAILTETIFAWPGLGRWMVSSVQARDYPVVQGGVLLMGSLVIAVNFIIDFIYIGIHPLIRSGHVDH